MKAVAFGEVLWDVNGDEKTLGGAPFNVLAHMRKLGGQVQIISAVGQDALGAHTLDCIEDAGISGQLIRISPFPTGRADITLVDGNASYVFNMPCAWDDIRLSPDQYMELFNDEFYVFIYGTLAQRCMTSALTLEKLLDVVSAQEYFFDVNLRGRFSTCKSIRRGLEKATILKMSDEELPAVAAMLSVDSEKLIKWLFDNTGVRKVLVTEGSRGASCYEKDGGSCHAGAPEVKVLDTVGAGDSLSAAFLHFLSRGENTGSALEKASLLAGYVVTKRGAVPEYDEELRAQLSLQGSVSSARPE